MTKRPIPTSGFAFRGEPKERQTTGGCLKTPLICALCAIISVIVARYIEVLLCDVWRLECMICR